MSANPPLRLVDEPRPFAPPEAYEDRFEPAHPHSAADVAARRADAHLRAPLEWSGLADRVPPAREWAVDHWLPDASPTLLAGNGGIGKTLFAQTTGTGISVGRNYFDVVSKRRRVLFWAGEDDPDELWRRQIAICTFYGITLAELQGHFILESYAARDLTLVAQTVYGFGPTPLLAELRAQVGDYKADYVFLDSVARIYGASENDRHQVTTAISMLMAAVAVNGAGLCLIGHPGKAIGSEYSGSTAWEGSVRSRLYLSSKLPNGDKDDDDSSDETRYLSRRKANYSAKDWRRFNYLDGVLVPVDAPRPVFGAPRGDFGKDIVLRAIRKLADLGMHGNAGTRSPDFLPKLAKDYQLLDGVSERQFGGYMRELIVERRLVSKQIGKYATNRNPKMGLVEVEAQP
ncbi:MAG: AAA family ATPase [Pseudomonadota bacterium]